MYRGDKQRTNGLVNSGRIPIKQPTPVSRHKQSAQMGGKKKTHIDDKQQTNTGVKTADTQSGIEEMVGPLGNVVH